MFLPIMAFKLRETVKSGMPIAGSPFPRGQLGVNFRVRIIAQGSNPLANWRLSSPKHVRKIYDKSTRGYVFDLGSGTQPCRMQLPNDKVRFFCQYLVFPALFRYMHDALRDILDLS